MSTEQHPTQTSLPERNPQLRDDEVLAQQHPPRASKGSPARQSSQESAAGGLRKSFSVDSFVRSSDASMSRSGPVSTTTANIMSGRPHALSMATHPTAGVLREADEYLEGRGRGSSLSSIASMVSTESRVRGEPDVDLSSRYDKGPSAGYPKASFTLPSIPPSLPTIPQNRGRVHALSSSSSLASTVSAHSASPSRLPEDSPVFPTLSSARSKSTNASRSRSGSLASPPPPPPPRRLHAALSLPTQLPRLSSPITLIVVGVAGCGKTAVIRKGLKGYGMSEPSASLPGTSPIIRYSRRTGKTKEHDVPLNVFEVDIESDAFAGDVTINTQQFLPETPRVDGVLICYDASSAPSFQPVESLLRGYLAIRTPTVVLACKSDLPKQIDPQNSLEVLQQYDVGLVEVTNADDPGREKMRRSMNWLVRAVNRARMSQKQDSLEEYRNPASPDLIKSNSNPWDTPASATSSTTSHLSSVLASIPSSPPAPSQEAASPVRVRTTSDLPSDIEREVPRSQDEYARSSPLLKRSTSVDSFRNNASTPTAKPSVTVEVHEEPEVVGDKPQQPNIRRGGPSAQWASLDELLDKLVFLAVSGDDPKFISHFLLTYRRFTTPRSVLLSMQKRMRLLDNPSDDPMFACYAQMKICHLLETWIDHYDYDFTVKGTAGALSALIKSILSKTYLLHYGSKFLPFLEKLPTLVDRDAPWSYKEENTLGEESSDEEDSYILEEPTTTLGSLEEDDEKEKPDPASSAMSLPEKKPQTQRERKGSLPLTARAILQQTSTSSSIASVDSAPGKGPDISTKELLRHLQRIAAELNTVDSIDIAQEITRWESELFLAIKPRHWLAFTLTSGKKSADECPVTRFNELSNRLGAWVVSLILCHDRPKARSRQLEKLVEVAQKLRALNNYSALRAFVAGINRSTFSGDPTMEQFRARCPEPAKTFQSWEMLLQQIRAHRAYRLALRNSKGACIPALEVHMSDLIRSHEGNPDTLDEDPSKIRWGKYSMMGRFVSTIMECQAQCVDTKDYDFAQRNDIKRMLETPYLMSEDIQQSRITPFEAADPMDELMRPPPIGASIPRPMGGNSGGGGSAALAPAKEGFKKLFLW